MEHVSCIYMDKDRNCTLYGCLPCPFDDVCQCQSSDLMTNFYELEPKYENDYDAAFFDLPF